MTERDLSEQEQELLRRVGGSVQVLVHDIRNHLTKVLGQAQMMAWKLSMAPGIPPEVIQETEDRSNRIVEAVRTCDQLLGHYQHTYRRAPVAPSVSLLSDLIEGAVRMLPEADLVRLDVDGGEGVWVMADPQQAPVAIRACLANALRATAPDGRASLSATVEGGEVCLAIVDEGIGMTAEQLESACLPFHSSWPDGGGPGVGLFIAERVATGCGGRLELASPGLERGVSARIFLPAAAAP